MAEHTPVPTEYVAARMLGSCRNGNEADGGRLYHAIRKDGLSWAAVCGKSPGRRSAGWANYPDALRPPTEVNCGRCLTAMRKFGVIKRPALGADASTEGAEK